MFHVTQSMCEKTLETFLNATLSTVQAFKMCNWSGETLGPAPFVSRLQKVIHYSMITQETDWLWQSNCVIIEGREWKIFFLPFFLPQQATVLELSWPRNSNRRKAPLLPSWSFLTTPLSFAPSLVPSPSQWQLLVGSFFSCAPSLPSHPSSGSLPLFSPSEDFMPDELFEHLTSQ